MTVDHEAGRTVYTFGMATYVHVQMKDIQVAARVHADSADWIGKIGEPGYKLELKLGTNKVAEFSGHAIQGWWIEEG